MKKRDVIYVILILALLALLQTTCNRVNKLKGDIEHFNTEILRKENNLKALNDTIQTYLNKQNEYVSEKRALVLKYDELKNEYENLFNDYNELKGEKTKTITQVKYVYIDTSFNVPTDINVNDSNITVNFRDSLGIDNYNYRVTNGLFKISLQNSPKVTYNTLSYKIGMSIKTGLYVNENDEVRIRVSTKMPNVTFTDIEGAYVLEDEDSKKALRKLRKTMSIGISVGYGKLIYNTNGALRMSNGMFIGIGLQYHPKWLQW